MAGLKSIPGFKHGIKYNGDISMRKNNVICKVPLQLLYLAYVVPASTHPVWAVVNLYQCLQS